LNHDNGVFNERALYRPRRNRCYRCRGFFLWRRHRNNAVKALQVSSGKDAVEKKNKKGEVIHIANCVIVRSRENGGAKYEYIEPAKIPVECTPTPTEWLNRSMYWLKGDGSKDSETLTPFTVSDEIVEYPGSLMDTIQAKPIKEFLKLPAGLLEKVAIWACVVVIGVGMSWLYRYQSTGKSYRRPDRADNDDTAGIDTHHPYHQYRDSAHYYIVRR